MALYTDMPTATDLEQLLSTRREGCVSIYMPTSTVTQEAEGDRIELKNLSADAIGQVEEAGMDKRELAAVKDALDDLIHDEFFWARQAHSLAVFATPDGSRTFRIPNRLTAMVEVSDRFHLKPLLPAVTFPQAAFVLALSQNGVRLLEVALDVPPSVLDVPGMPSDAASAVGKASIGDRSADRRIQGSEGKKVRLGQSPPGRGGAAADALGRHRPLILASPEPLASIFRGSHLSAPCRACDPREPRRDLGRRARRREPDRARRNLRRRARGLRSLYEQRTAQGRASDKITTLARAATFGAVDTAFVDIDETVPGFIDEETGEVTLEEADDAINYGVVDEIARRVLRGAAASSPCAAKTSRAPARPRRSCATRSDRARQDRNATIRVLSC